MDADVINIWKNVKAMMNAVVSIFALIINVQLPLFSWNDEMIDFIWAS